MGYISVSNGQFIQNSARFRFIGVNCYPLIQNNLSTTVLDDFFNKCNEDGITVVRAWAFNKTVPATNSVGNFRYLSGGALYWVENTFISLDRVLDSARRHNVKLVLSLVDNNGNNKEDYLTWSDTIYSTSYGSNEWNFFDDTNVRQWYKDFVDKLASRVNTINGRLYSEDETIFSIELGNELRYDKGSDPDINTIDSFNLAQLGGPGGWADVMSTYIKTKFPNNLVGYGDLAHFYTYSSSGGDEDAIYNGSFYGVDYGITGGLDNIDYFDVHIYPFTDSPGFLLRKYGIKLGFPGAGVKSGLVGQLQEFIRIAKAADKPVIIGEWGLDKRNEVLDDYPSYPRTEHFKKLFRDWFGNGADGILIWHYATSAILDDNNYNIKPNGVHAGSNDPGNRNTSDSSLRLLMRQYARKFAGRRKIA